MLTQTDIKNTIKSNNISKNVLKQLYSIYKGVHVFYWNNREKNIFGIKPANPTLLYGRIIYNTSDYSILCRDFPTGTKTASPMPDEKQKIPIFENQHSIRMFYNPHTKQNQIVTSNKLNANNTIYSTNKNADGKHNNINFGMQFKKYDINGLLSKKIDPNYTYTYALFTPEIYITSEVKHGHIIYISRINNADGKIEINKNLNDVKHRKIGWIIIHEDRSSVYYTPDHMYKLQLMNNCSDIYQIIVHNITTNSVPALREHFPFWNKFIDNVLNILRKKAKHIQNIYNILYMSHRDTPDRRRKIINILSKIINDNILSIKTEPQLLKLLYNYNKHLYVIINQLRYEFNMYKKRITYEYVNDCISRQSFGMIFSLLSKHMI